MQDPGELHLRFEPGLEEDASPRRHPLLVRSLAALCILALTLTASSVVVVLGRTAQPRGPCDDSPVAELNLVGSDLYESQLMLREPALACEGQQVELHVVEVLACPEADRDIIARHGDVLEPQRGEPPAILVAVCGDSLGA